MKNEEVKIGDEVVVNGRWAIVDAIEENGFWTVDEDGKDFFVESK